ncbi:MAG: FadR/GntR family transcriptional regulator [Gammaproteobacteria bacterium]|nr:FadR/GntR family transcriptional regulator [Gammaproteobacteria bacterium]
MSTEQYGNPGLSGIDLNPGSTGTTTRLGVTATNVVSQLRRMILEGQFAHEERLPAERNLAEEFKVSRGTIRTVLQILEQQHLVTRKVGSGTYVTHREPSNQHDISAITSPLEMVEVRIAIEPQMVRLAISNASHRDLEELRIALRQCEDCGGDPEKFAIADTAFHMALAQCSKNKLMLWVYDRISEVRRYSQWRLMKAKLLTPERIDYYNNQHREIYQAIASRDANKAVQTIKNHLYGVHDDLLDTEG